MRRIKLRTMILLVALLAVFLAGWTAFERRRSRLLRLARAYNMKAGALENTLVNAANSTSQDDASAILSRVHWHDSVTWAYIHASKAPWAGSPDPLKVQCRCGGCITGRMALYQPTSADILPPAATPMTLR